MVENILYLNCSILKNNHLIVDEIEDLIILDINPSSENDAIYLNKESAKILVNKINALLAK